MTKKLLFVFLLVVGMTFTGNCWADSPKQIEALQAKVDAGDMDALGAMISLYQVGRGETAKDPAKAFALIQKAVEMGSPVYQRVLANVYLSGKLSYTDLTVEKDPTLAVELLEKSAAQNDKDALYSLARMYEKGENVTQDIEKAKALYQGACDNGHTGACNNKLIAPPK